MAETTHIPDAPFRSGITGKYKLLIRNVTPKFGSYEYELEDAEGKEYKAVAKEHYSEGELLRCIVSFEVVKARLVVSDVAVCKKQDLTTPVVENKESRPQPKPKSAKATKKPNSPFVLIDELQNNGEKKGPMSEGEVQLILKQIEIQKDKRNCRYRCCGTSHESIYLFRKHLFECHPLEYTKFFSSALQREGPSSVRGVGIGVHKKTKSKKGYSKEDDVSPKRCKGDHFHLIYTPMGNKR